MILSTVGRFTVGLTTLLSVVGISHTATAVAADEWPQWRGPLGTSVSTATGLPREWSETKGIAWKTAIPAWGTSTPVIWDAALFITTEHNNELQLLRLNVTSGAIEWTRTIASGTPARAVKGGGKRTAKFHDLHNLASPSPVTDGQVVVAHFGSGDLAAFSFDGTLLWKRNLATDHASYTIWWGHANSPIIVGDAVISVCMQDSLDGDVEQLVPSYLVAHHKRTGEPLWYTPRMTGAHAEEGDAYTTPLLLPQSNPPTLIVMGGNQLDAYDAITGQQRWKVPGLVGGRTITGPTLTGSTNGGHQVLATVGMRGPLQAFSLTDAGQLAPSEGPKWKETASTPDSCCPVAANGLVWVVTDNGIATCLDAVSGERKYRERLGGRDYKASPVVADGAVYFLSKDGLTTVLAAEPTFKVIAENKLDDEFLASPAIAHGRVYLRGKQSVYAIGK